MINIQPSPCLERNCKELVCLPALHYARINRSAFGERGPVLLWDLILWPSLPAGVGHSAWGQEGYERAPTSSLPLAVAGKGSSLASLPGYESPSVSSLGSTLHIIRSAVKVGRMETTVVLRLRSGFELSSVIIREFKSKRRKIPSQEQLQDGS